MRRVWKWEPLNFPRSSEETREKIDRIVDKMTKDVIERTVDFYDQWPSPPCRFCGRKSKLIIPHPIRTSDTTNEEAFEKYILMDLKFDQRDDSGRPAIYLCGSEECMKKAEELLK